MERNRLFHPVLFRILRPIAIQSLPLIPKNFDLGIPNPKSELFVNNRKITKRSIPFRSIPFQVLVTTATLAYQRSWNWG